VGYAQQGTLQRSIWVTRSVWEAVVILLTPVVKNMHSAQLAQVAGSK